MGTALAVLGQFGEGFDFILHERESRGGATVGGAHNLELLVEHLKVSGAAMAVALVVALPVGLALGHAGRFQFLAVSTSNVGRAVPSLALIALFVAFFPSLGSFANVTVALALLAIPPILTNAYVGVRQVDPDAVDAARGMGMTHLGVIRRVEWPLAVPLVFGGIRTSAVNVVATATIAPLAGVVTLGDPIINDGVYGTEGAIGASIIVAVLAIATEYGLGGVQRLAGPKGTINRKVRPVT